MIFILVGGRVFSLAFYGVDGHRGVAELLVSLPGGQTGFLIFVNAFVFVLAFFLDFFEHILEGVIKKSSITLDPSPNKEKEANAVRARERVLVEKAISAALVAILARVSTPCM